MKSLGRVASILLIQALALMSSPAPSLGQVQNAQQRGCINGLNQNLEGLWQNVTRNLLGCVERGGEASLPPGVTDIDQCVSLDLQQRVARAELRTTTTGAESCDVSPDFGPNDATAVISAGKGEAAALFEDIWGADLDSSIVLESANQQTFQCQLRVAEAVAKCGTVRLRQYNKCKKKVIEGDPAAAQSSTDLEEECLMQAGDPTTGQPDPKGKIANACDRNDPPVKKDKILRAINHHCATTSPTVPPSVAFPGCDSDGSWVFARAGCLMPAASCRVCRAIVLADNLARDCDLFDNGIADGSCPP